MNTKLIRELMQAPGVSGDESKIAEIFIREAKANGFAIEKDNLGSVYITKKSKNKKALKVLFDAHMDEVGFMVMGITETGLIEIDVKGGVWKHSLAYQRMSVWNDNADKSYSGVITFPRPALPNDAPSPIPDIENLHIDLGASTKKEVEKMGISIGNQITFDTRIEENGNRMIGKAVDDRAGLAILIELMPFIKDLDLDYDLYIGASVQEEVGLRGARTMSFKINPDLAVAIDISPAKDIPAPSKVGDLGLGTYIRHKDAYTIYPKSVTQYLEELFEKNKIKWQNYISAGGTNAGIIHTNREGITTIPLGFVARNLHTGSTVFDKGDYEETLKAAKAIIKDLNTQQIERIIGK